VLDFILEDSQEVIRLMSGGFSQRWKLALLEKMVAPYQGA
jgi:hypothetical protein